MLGRFWLISAQPWGENLLVQFPFAVKDPRKEPGGWDPELLSKQERRSEDKDHNGSQVRLCFWGRFGAQAQERRVLWDQAPRHWENESFFDQNKNKRNFQGRFKNNTIPSANKLFNYYTRKANNNYQLNSQPGKFQEYHIIQQTLITTRPQPQD